MKKKIWKTLKIIKEARKSLLIFLRGGKAGRFPGGAHYGSKHMVNKRIVCIFIQIKSFGMKRASLCWVETGARDGSETRKKIHETNCISIQTRNSFTTLLWSCGIAWEVGLDSLMA